jgi:Glycosyltransferase family 9 (heptosyltransferase)/Tetratricopeptide repeat
LWKAFDYADVARFSNAHGAHATTIDAVRVGLTLDPDNAMLYVYRACAYDEFGRSDEAIADCQTALRLDPQGRAGILALMTLALVRERIGDPDGALAAAQQAIAIDPADREAHSLLGTLLAWRGAWRAAWPELECHWIDERIAFRQRFPDLREWNGEDIAGQRLLLVHNQGLGDIVQMLRYAPQVRARCAELLLEVPPTMLELVRGAAGIDAVFAKGSAPRERFDGFARLMTLARLCGEDGAPGGVHVPYLQPNPERLATWSQRIGPRDERTRVGLAWAGNPFHLNDRRRSMPIERLAPLGNITGVRWFSLQFGPRAADAPRIGFELERFDATIADMADTAALIAQLDLVIAVDTGVAHLAGALGKPVWLLLPWRTEWRWPPIAETTPWYPAMRIFHSQDPSWNTAIVAVLDALSTRER